MVLLSLLCFTSRACIGQDTLCVTYRYHDQPTRHFSKLVVHNACFSQGLKAGCTVLGPRPCAGKSIALQFQYRGRTVSFDSIAYGCIKYHWIITAHDVGGQRNRMRLELSFASKATPNAVVTDPAGGVPYSFEQVIQWIK